MDADCHIHMALDGLDYKKSLACQPDERLIRARLAAYRHGGITQIRDGGDRFGAAALAAKLSAEYGIDYRQPGFPLFKNGHYGGFLGRGFDTLADFAALVNRAKREGASFIKIMASGLMDFDRFGALTGPAISALELYATIACCHDYGFAAMVHCNGAQSVRSALAAGADSVEHGAYLDDECLAQLGQSNTIWVPTLVTISNLIGRFRHEDAVLKSILAQQMQNVATAVKYGATIAAGSDAGAFGVYHIEGAATEFSLLEEAIGQGARGILHRGQAEIFRRFCI